MQKDTFINIRKYPNTNTCGTPRVCSPLGGFQITQAAALWSGPKPFVLLPRSVRLKYAHPCWNNTLCPSQLWQEVAPDESPNVCLLRRKV